MKCKTGSARAHRADEDMVYRRFGGCHEGVLPSLKAIQSLQAIVETNIA